MSFRKTFYRCPSLSRPEGLPNFREQRISRPAENQNLHQAFAALIRRAHALDYQLVVIQQTPLSAPYHQAEYPPRPLFVVGAEDDGVPQPLRRAADLLVEIPQYGLIDSLNVAAAATVVMFHWRTHV